MRYMGAKGKLLDFIEYGLKESGAEENSNTFADVFSGTSSVGSFFKQKGFSTYSSDIMYMSYVLQRAYIENSSDHSFGDFGSYEKALYHLNTLLPEKGYVWRHFTEEGTKNDEHQRMFFIPANGQKIDAIRNELERLKSTNSLNENEFFILLATLLESLSFHSNVSGVYAAFLKKYDPRSLKEFVLRPINYSTSGEGKSFHGDGLSLLSDNVFDVIYLDPPYNQRQYAPNYHVIETIARWDNPEPRGKAGIREYLDLKSNFCSKAKAIDELKKYVESDSYKYLALSYNSEGIMKKDEIIDLLSSYGKTDFYSQEHLRFKSNNNGESSNKKHIDEFLFVLER